MTKRETSTPGNQDTSRKDIRLSVAKKENKRIRKYENKGLSSPLVPRRLEIPEGEFGVKEIKE